ncbi:MAG: Rho termination factor N-terminal domain-containing protein [Chloroflexota bacterium]|nr:Rho termination factor N-terminal domain-containing protein [Chloroflexota bacterium]
MTKVHFTGRVYHSTGYHFPGPGLYEVDEAKAQQLFADFPDQFSAVEPEAPETSKTTDQDQTQDQTQQHDEFPNLREMKRGELEAYAAEHGVEHPSEYPNKDELIVAIEAAEKK